MGTIIQERMQRIINNNFLKENAIFKIAAGLIILCICLFLFIKSKPILAPLIFAGLISGLVYNMYCKIVVFIKIKWLASLSTILLLVIPVLLLVGILGLQFQEVFSESDQLISQIDTKSKTSLNEINKVIPKSSRISKREFQDYISQGKDQLWEYLQNGISSGLSMLVDAGLTLIYIFFILLYSSGFKQFIITQIPIRKRESGIMVMSKMKDMIRGYLSGLGLVVVILSVLNSVGLLFFGVKYAIMWGCLAGFLAVIPYVGTIVGSLLPILFSFATSDSISVPIGIAIYFLIIQQVEGNFVTPKIIGNKININPFFAILSVVFFGYIWGITGAMLGLPLIGLIKIILSSFDKTAALGTLLSEEIDDDKFENEMDGSKYRVIT